jgi:hypothetical protein
MKTPMHAPALTNEHNNFDSQKENIHPSPGNENFNVVSPPSKASNAKGSRRNSLDRSVVLHTSPRTSSTSAHSRALSFEADISNTSEESHSYELAMRDAEIAHKNYEIQLLKVIFRFEPRIMYLYLCFYYYYFFSIFSQTRLLEAEKSNGRKSTSPVHDSKHSSTSPEKNINHSQLHQSRKNVTFERTNSNSSFQKPINFQSHHNRQLTKVVSDVSYSTPDKELGRNGAGDKGNLYYMTDYIDRAKPSFYGNSYANTQPDHYHQYNHYSDIKSVAVSAPPVVRNRPLNHTFSRHTADQHKKQNLRIVSPKNLVYDTPLNHNSNAVGRLSPLLQGVVARIEDQQHRLRLSLAEAKSMLK